MCLPKLGGPTLHLGIGKIRRLRANLRLEPRQEPAAGLSCELARIVTGAGDGRSHPRVHGALCWGHPARIGASIQRGKTGLSRVCRTFCAGQPSLNRPRMDRGPLCVVTRLRQPIPRLRQLCGDLPRRQTLLMQLNGILDARDPGHCLCIGSFFPSAPLHLLEVRDSAAVGRHQRARLMRRSGTDCGLSASVCVRPLLPAHSRSPGAMLR